MNITHKLISTLCLVAATAVAAAAAAPKYIFYYIGDGMGFNHVVNAQIYSNEVLGNDSTLTMLSMPVASMARTHSASSDVTDSAAAGTALSTGHKTRNNMLGMDADSLAVTSIAKTLHDNGWGVGLVTTVAIDDATPGAFYAHVPSRSEYMTVGRQLAESGYQFAAGAGLRAARDGEGRKTPLLDYFAEKGVTVTYGPAGLDVEADRLLVLSSDTVRTWNVGYTIDSVPGALTLPAMTAAGIRQLERVSPERFFMMVEGGNIDHAGHANDGGTILREVIDFDKSLALAWNFYLAHPDETLIVVSADHETGGFSIGTTTTGYSVRPEVTACQKISKDLFSEYVKSLARDRRIYRWSDMEEY
ncbi:MAG: alkaline phosphatase, partial [Muribaculaceae bacterium]|nr:alkaline phosphatase [Muribaculaceae bacterium]